MHLVLVKFSSLSRLYKKMKKINHINGPNIIRFCKEDSYTSSKVTKEYKLQPMIKFTFIWLIQRPLSQRLRTWCLILWAAIRWCLDLKWNMELHTNKIKDHLTYIEENMNMILRYQLSIKIYRDPLDLNWINITLLLSHKPIKFLSFMQRHLKNWAKFQ